MRQSLRWVALVATLPACQPAEQRSHQSLQPPSASHLSQLGIDGAQLVTPDSWIDQQPREAVMKRKEFRQEDKSAKLSITIEPVTSHASAVEILKMFAEEPGHRGQFVEVAGWPAYQRRPDVELKPMRGRRYVVQVAADRYQIHAEVFLYEYPIDARLAEVNAILQAMRLPFIADARATARELDALQRSVPQVATPYGYDDSPPAQTGAVAHGAVPRSAAASSLQHVELTGIEDAELTVPALWAPRDPLLWERSSINVMHLVRPGGAGDIWFEVSGPASHASAVEALEHVASEEHYKGQFVEMSGWPAYQRVRPEHQEFGRTAPQRYYAHIAAGHYQIDISIEAPELVDVLPADLSALLQTIRFPFAVDAARTAAELADLRHSVPDIAPPLAGANPKPRTGPVLLAANDTMIYERDEDGSAFVWSPVPMWREKRGLAGRKQRTYLNDELVTFSAGGPCACGVYSDGSLACFAEVTLGVEDLPVGRFVEVAASGRQTQFHDTGWCGVGATTQANCNLCAADAEGRVVCAAASNYVIPPAGRFHGLVASNDLTCGLDAEERVACWTPERNPNYPNPKLQTPADSFAQITLGKHQSCGRRHDGSVTCWQTWETKLDRRECPSRSACGIANPRGFKFNRISSGSTHNCGITTEGRVHCWGDRRQGQLAAPSGQFASIVSADGFSCAMRTSGEVSCWGKYFTTQK